MNHQTVGREAIRQDVIGNPLVEHIILVLIVFVVQRIGIAIVVHHPLFHVLRHDILGRLAQLFLPPFIGFRKDGESILAMLRCVGIVSVHRGKTSGCGVNAFGQHARLAQAFIDFVTHCIQRIHISTGHNAACCDEIGSLLFLQHFAQLSSQRHDGGSDDFLHLMDDAIQDEDVAVAVVNGAVAIDVDAVRLVLDVVDSQFASVHVADGKLGIVRRREASRLIDYIVAAVDNRIVDDNPTDRVQFDTIRECLPRRLSDEFLLHQIEHVVVDGVVRRSKYSVIPARAHQLSHGGFAHRAHLHPVQQIHIFRVFFMLLQVGENRIRLEYIA